MSYCDGKSEDCAAVVDSLSTGAISIKYSVLSAVHHTQTVPSLNPTISPGDYLLIYPHLIHSCEPAELPV